MKMGRLIEMCPNETYSTPRVGHILYEMFQIRNGLKQGHALWPLLFNFAFEYAITKDQVKKDDLKLLVNGTHQLMLMMFI